jgi:alpha-L-fucosidase 2
MDMEILRDLFTNCIQASEILGTDKNFRAQLAAARARLAPLQIGSAGQLQEWLQDWDMQAPDLHHRHVSHLYGLFPGAQIDVNTTPELAAAVKKSLEIRGDRPPAGPPPGASIFGRACTTATTPIAFCNFC